MMFIYIRASPLNKIHSVAMVYDIICFVPFLRDDFPASSVHTLADHSDEVSG